MLITTVGAGEEQLTLVTLAGEIDFHLAPELMERTRNALDHGAKTVAFDLTDVTLIDSTTLGTMLSAHKRLSAGDGRMCVVCPDPVMAKIFSITGLDRLFPVHKDLGSLLAA
jgi:anti-sigma B factor antagonist